MSAKHPAGSLRPPAHAARALATALAALLAFTGCGKRTDAPAPRAAASAAGPAAAATGPQWAADHHMHVFSENVSRLVRTMCQRIGCPEGFPTAATSVHAAVAALDAAGIRQGVLLSTAYLYGAPEAKGLTNNVGAAIRAENAMALARADAACGRLVPFIGVDPLEPSALAEIDYWAKDPRVRGIKLHMAGNDVDLRDDAQLEQLARVFAKASGHGLAIVIHLRNRNPEFGATDVRNFVDRVLPAARGVPVQIAHVAGPGGAEVTGLGVFAELLRARPELRSQLYFDLAMVPDILFDGWVEHAEDDVLAALRRLIDEIGVDRFLLASDWAGAPDLKEYYAMMRARLELPPEKWAQLASQAAPYLAGMGTGACGP